MILFDREIWKEHVSIFFFFEKERESLLVYRARCRSTQARACFWRSQDSCWPLPALLEAAFHKPGSRACELLVVPPLSPIFPRDRDMLRLQNPDFRLSDLCPEYFYLLSHLPGPCLCILISRVYFEAFLFYNLPPPPVFPVHQRKGQRLAWMCQYSMCALL